MMSKGKRVSALVVAFAASFAATACGPAVQPTSGGAASSAAVKNPAQTGTLVSPNGWLAIEAGAQAGAQVKYYKEQLTASMIEGSLHSGYSVYGSLNPPDRAYLALREGNTSTYYYQQGKVAYYEDNGRWSETTPIANINVYPSYEQLIQQASKAGIALYQQKRTYVFDEYCDVYTSILPGSMLGTLPALGTFVTGGSGKPSQVAVTWYVGQSDHILRKVDMQTVGGVPDIGSMQVNISTLTFDINSSIAKVSLPKDLVKQLENVSN